MSNSQTSLLLDTSDLHNDSTNNDQSELINPKEQINLATHNIRGLNNLTKLHLWLDYCLQEKLHIISLTETKLKDNSRAYTNPHYKIFVSNFQPTSLQNRETSMGTALLVHNSLQPYIHDINIYPGTAIYVDFFFPGNKTRIISTYLPSNNADLLTRTQKQLSLWILEAKRKQWHILLLGDFNANFGSHKKSRLPIFSDLLSNNITSLMDFHKITDPTWHGRGLSSQIDDIWVSPQLLLNFDPPQLTNPAGISDSDHCILSSVWYTNFNPATPRNKKRKRKTFCYERTTIENWDEFSNTITTLISKANFPSDITSPEQLDKTWNLWSNAISQSAHKHIPKTTTVSKPFHALSLKATQLHSALKNINKCIHLLSKAMPPMAPLFLLQTINKHLNKALSLAQLPLFALTPLVLSALQSNTPYTHYATTITSIKEIRSTIWKARNAETYLQQMEKIKFYTNRRYNDFKDNTGRMINSILKKEKDHISFDKIITTETIITDPNEIKTATSNHFKNWTKHNPTNEEHWDKWKSHYDPLESIHPSIYSNLPLPFTLDELISTISAAPKHKATGPNNISNEMLQHIPKSALDKLLDMFNACLRLERTPSPWLKSNIWPIPKKTRYNFELCNTRPITLIDHSRKIFTKLLTNRLSDILLKHRVLSPLNYAALPFQSTLQPISQLSSIIEIATTQKQELWLLLQDMSKAFDSIHIPMLKKALTRIKLPSTIINLLIHILSNRSNQVITNLGYTNSYPVEDGIDQGETISPILWVIYYDPLIRRISTEYPGFSQTISTPTQTKTTHTSIMAYMDDSLWIAPDKTTLEKILNTANSFYKLTNITVNPIKSILVTNAKTDNKSINFNNQTITAINNTKPFKYLGAWFSLNPNPSSTQKTIISEFKQCIGRMQKAVITEKQAIYLINNVLIPRLAYRLYSSYLSPNQLVTLTRLYSNLVKSKAKLARGVPNSFLFHRSIYGLKNLIQIQPTSLATSLLKNINHPSFETSFLKLRLQELQESTKSQHSILHVLPLFPSGQARTYTAQAILALHTLNIQLTRNPETDWPKPLPTTGTSINEILRFHPNAQSLKEKLNLHNIRYIEQFLNYNNNELLNWKNFHHNILKIPPGRTPRWFTEIQDLISANANPSTQLVHPNPFTLTKRTHKKKSWIITSNLHIGRTSRSSKSTIYIRHYLNLNNQASPCPGCKLKDTSLNTKNCYFKYDTNYTYVIQVSSDKNIHSNLEDIESALSTCYPNRIPISTPLTAMTTNRARPLKAFTTFPMEIWEELAKTQNKRRSVNIFISTTTPRNNQATPYATCSFQNTSATWGCTNKNWPSTANSALTLFAFISTSFFSGTTISVTSNNHKFLTLLQQTYDNPSHRLLNLEKKQYAPILFTLKAIIMNLKLKFCVDKDLTHPRKPDNFMTLDIIPHQLLFNKYTPNLLNTPCPHTLKTILKDIIEINNHALWTNQNRISYWINRYPNIQIRLTLDYLSFEERPLSLSTNPTFSQLKNFKVKLLTNELPTFKTLHERSPFKYQDYRCPRCLSSEETIAHLISCTSNNSSLISLLKDIIQALATELKLDLVQPVDFTSSFIHLHVNNQLPLGFITVATLAPFARPSDKLKYAPALHHLIIKMIYHEIWLPSRQIRHDPVIPTPTPLPNSNRSYQYNNFNSFNITLQSHLDKYIALGRSYLYSFED